MLVTVLAFVVVLGITITIHEFGHFAVAKLLKIRVLVFSLGFGPRLAGFTRGGTEYRISPFPLGGYVKMAGESFDDQRQGAPDEFLSHPKWHRFLVAFAGPFMNIVLAIAIVAFSYMEGVYVAKYEKEAAIVGPVSFNSIAQRAGLKTGDKIVSVHGNIVRDWEDMEIALGTAPKEGLDIEVERGQEGLELHFPAPADAAQIDPAALGFKNTLPRAIVGLVDPNSPAQASGLKKGDELISVRSGEKVGKGYDEILNIISASKGIPLDFEVLRPHVPLDSEEDWSASNPSYAANAQTLHLTITPIEDKGHVIIGFRPDYPVDHKQFGLGGAIAQSVRRNYEMSVTTFKIIGRIFQGSASVKNLSGPIEIARVSGSVARTGDLRYFISFIGLISLNLGIFNLLPIPIVDGGVITLLLIEGIMGRDISLALKERILQAGFVFLILLMSFVVFNDLSRIVNFEKLFR
jgi:regulator of sigma E protease